MKTLILGIGNPFLGDDGIGVHIARELAGTIRNENIDVKDSALAGLNLLELIPGYNKVIIIDAIMTEDGKAGEIYKLEPEAFFSTVHVATSPHNANLATAIEIGKKAFAEKMPREIVVFAIEIQEVTEFIEEMTEKVREAMHKVIKLVLEELDYSKESYPPRYRISPMKKLN